MMTHVNSKVALLEHLETGCTTICRCWHLRRSDGWARGFTDHDEDIEFDADLFRASTGFTASAIEETSGLSVNNSEMIGALSDAGISEEDIVAGRFDGAEVVLWIVNWRSPDQRAIQFRGSLGEVSRTDGRFSAELRGLAEALNQPMGRVYQKDCSAVLGDRKCRVDTASLGFSCQADILDVEDARIFNVPFQSSFPERWFERGCLELIGGKGIGLIGSIKSDRVLADIRRIELWQSLRAEIVPGDKIQLVAGCDKRMDTCGKKFRNFVNFRGFPHIPGEDWLTGYPRKGRSNDGGSMNLSTSFDI